jgi:isopentenyl-diphosphate delta-isomerase
MMPEAHDRVVVVDVDDRPLATADKLEAHSGRGLLHRAVSACLFDQTGRLLLQRRAQSKYHFAGRWSNAACTHPRPGESPAGAIARRLGEELGVRATRLIPCGTFLYQAADPASGLVERELDHVYAGWLDSPPAPDPAEVMDWRLVRRSDLGPLDRLDAAFTPWLAPVLQLAFDAVDSIERSHSAVARPVRTSPSARTNRVASTRFTR